jgi:hypothetical protein
VLSVLGAASIVLASAVVDVSQASADAGVVITIGKATLTNRLLVNIPVTVVCAAIPGADTEFDLVQVSLQQAVAKSVSSGSGSLSGGSFDGNAGLFTCDGLTANTFNVSFIPGSGSGPFKGGGAILTVNASHTTEDCPFCGVVASEGTQLGPQSIKL